MARVLYFCTQQPTFSFGYVCLYLSCYQCICAWHGNVALFVRSSTTSLSSSYRRIQINSTARTSRIIRKHTPFTHCYTTLHRCRFVCVHRIHSYGKSNTSTAFHLFSTCSFCMLRRKGANVFIKIKWKNFVASENEFNIFISRLRYFACGGLIVLGFRKKKIFFLNIHAYIHTVIHTVKSVRTYWTYRDKKHKSILLFFFSSFGWRNEKIVHNQNLTRERERLRKRGRGKKRITIVILVENGKK